MNVLLPLKSDEQYLNMDMWQPSDGLARIDRMLELHLVNQTDTSD
jgi:hypothetical protein